MGWYLFWRKILILPAVFFAAVFFFTSALLWAGDGEGGPLEISPEQRELPRNAGGFEASPRTFTLTEGERRAALRTYYEPPLRAEEGMPRQFHGGPEIFSPDFRLTPEVKAHLDTITASQVDGVLIAASLKRGSPYTHFIREKIEEYGLPPEVFYLPLVESLYKINARSRSGALGLWQFMRNSISPWMLINEWLDERKDFWKSTVAAMEKLSYNYKVTGDWLLALAAYNCGLGRIQKTVKQSGVKDFWELSRRGLIPRETRAYIPRLIAVARFASSMGRRGIHQGPQTEWTPPVRWERVPLNSSVDLRLLAQAAGVPHAALVEGNEELLYGVTPPYTTGYHLKVASEHTEKVKAALEKSAGSLIKFRIHTIAEGHTLSELAQHYGVSVSVLLRHNPGTRPEALRPGSRLVIPLYRDVAPYEKTPYQAGHESQDSAKKGRP